MVYFHIMDTGIQPQLINIKDLILTVRATQVLLDSDVAMLYGYETKYITRAVSRNKARFPESFCFRLTKEEADGIERLRFHSGTSNTSQRGGRRYLPYVFAEQGIAMLSGLLKNDIAVQVSIGIMNAFVEMRKLLSAHGSIFERMMNLEYKMLVHDRQFDQVFKLIQPPELPRQGVFFQGQIFDAYDLVLDIIRNATSSIVIVDNYANDSVLKMLKEKSNGVCVSLITSRPDAIAQQSIDKFNQQYSTIEVIKHKGFHDRFIIIDDSTVYHVGASLKDLGKKCFAMTVLGDASRFTQEIQGIVQTARII
jgi:hypothetical protein